MKLTFNGATTTVQHIGDNIEVKIHNMSKKLFKKYVRAFTKDLKNVRKKVRLIIEEWLKDNRDIGITMPNMNSGKKHGNKIVGNMLKHIIYDKTMYKTTFHEGGLSATVEIPYGIDTDGTKNLVKNKKGVTYAQILDKWNGQSEKYNNPKIKRFNGFIDKIRTEYRYRIMAQLQRSLTDKYQETIK